ncbi:MAG TPA: DUF2249 domain-containing protein [Xanthobacteraceae bacterium]|nr:DUF2249 domain-containing protein [Xanthobacteraceae bacterium]
MAGHTWTVDVRSIPHIGGEPFALVMREVSGLRPGEVLRVLAGCESIPLFEALGGNEFSHEAHRLEQDDWEVLFTRIGPAPSEPEPAAPPRAPAAWAIPTVRLDNRGLPPTEPVMRVLELLEQMHPGEVMEVLSDQELSFLYPELHARGHATSAELGCGHHRLLIRRGTPQV